MSHPSQGPTDYPQDAPLTQPIGPPPTEGMRPAPTTSWPTWRPAAATPSTATPAPAQAQAQAQAQPTVEPTAAARAQWTPPPVPPPAPKVTHVPAPTGPNWGLVLFGLVVLAVGGGIVANQTTGFQASDVTTFGPSVFVLGGLLCALIGLVGIVSRRRR